MELPCPLGTNRLVPLEIFPRKPYNKCLIDQAIINALLTKLFRSRWLDIGLFLQIVYVFIELEFFSVYKHAKKKTWSISSHLDLTLTRSEFGWQHGCGHIRGIGLLMKNDELAML